MERADEKERGDRGSRKSLSPSKDDSLTDFKSPKLETAAPIRAKIIIDKRTKKSSSRGKTSVNKKKKETVVKEVAQPSIESSFFKATVINKRDGHTCPLCMKYFADVGTGTAHTKSCAAKNHVSTKKLLAAVALQERQANERVAIGLPAGPIVLPKEKTPRRPREAGAKGDPDLQLALALSKSLQENQLEQEFEEALLLAAEHRGDGQIVGFSSDTEKRKTLTNFGFLTNKPAGVSEGPGRTRRKKHLGPTILQTRSQEARERILTERVAEILMGNEAITQVCRQEAIAEVEPVKDRKITLRSHLLREIHRTTKRVWDIAQTSTKTTDFYVEILAPIISPAEQEKQESPENIAEERDHDDENSRTKTDVQPAIPEESPLDEDDIQTEKLSESSEENEKTNECAKERLKIPSPNNIHITDRQYRNTLPMDWTNTLNVSSMSDVVILVKNGHIWAHKLVFYVRCSEILLDCDPNSDTKFSHVKEKISWPDVDLSTGLAFLEFVYSGLIEKNINVFSDNSVAIGVRRLARKYKVKALFDYLRRKQAEFPKVDNVLEEVESRKFGLCSPVVIEVTKAPSYVETVEENLPEKEEHKDAEEVEGRKSGLCSPIVIQVDGTPSDVESSKENPQANGDSKDEEKDYEPMQISPSHDNDEFFSAETNTLMQKPADGDSQSRNTDAMSVISITSSRSRRSMSPDLFDETTEEASVDTAKNSEEVAGNPHLSDEEDTNLNALAGLIAENDFRSSSEPAISQDKIAEKSPSLNEIREFSSTTQHVETPKSRNNSVIELGSEIKEKSRTQLFPEKPKSNLSLFIAKIQKMNAKGPLDSYTEEESLAEAPVMIRRRNPFNVNNVTDKSIEDSNEKLPNKLGRGRDGKRGLSIFDEPFKPINPKKVNLEETTTADDNIVADESAQPEESYLVDETFNTDEEDISMYSKYRRTHMHNNSISNYRNMLKKIENTTMPAENDDKSDNPKSPNEKPIDLTQDSDSDVNMPPSPMSGTSPINEQKIADDTSDSDSIHSAATAIAHYDYSHEDSKDAETGKATSVASSEKRKTNDGKSKSKKSGTDSEGSSDSDDALTESSSSKKLTKQDKTKVVKSIENFEKKKQNVPKCSTEKSPESVKSLTNSPRHSNHDLLEGDEEIFARSWESKTPSPSKSSAAVQHDILSPESKKNTKKDKTKSANSVDNSNKNEPNVPKYSINISSGSGKSSRNSSQHSLHELLEGDTEIFARSWKSKTPSPSKNSASPVEISSPRRTEKANKSKTKGANSVDDLNKNQQKVPQISIDISPGSVKSLRNSPRYFNHDFLDDDEIFAQSWKSRTPSPLPNFSALSAGPLSSGRKRKSEEIREKHESLKKNVDSENVQLHASKNLSKSTKSPRNSQEYSDLDVFEIDEEIFAQSSKKARVLQQSPSTSQKRSFNYSDNSVSSRRKRRAEEKNAKENSIGEDSGPKNVTNSTDYPDDDDDDLITQNLREAMDKFRKAHTPSENRTSASPEKSASSRDRNKSNREKRKTPEINIHDFEKDKSNKSLEASKSLRNSPSYHYEDFEPDNNVFTQSFNLRRESPCRTLSPLPNCASTSKNNDHSSTRKIPSPILISSSPEFDIDAEINFSNHEPDAFISNKENLYTNDRTSPLLTRKSCENLAEVISPTNFESSRRFSRDAFEKSREKTSTSNVERPTSPQPSTSSKSSSNRRESASSASKNSLVRWNSMPANSSKAQVGCKRSRTPTQSSRLIMSQDVTPPVNYDMMDTPELKKELSKYGIKPQPRTRARKLLTHIYNELHPLVPASPEGNESSDHLALSDDDDEPPAKKIVKPINQNSEEFDSDRELPLSQESVARAANPIPEEIDFADGNLSPDDGEEMSSNSIKKAFKALLKADKEMHNKVLIYEPLPLELLHLMLKTGGLKCKLKDLMDFLDEECITFQVQSQRSQSRVRGKKTARGRKGIASTQKS